MHLNAILHFHPSSLLVVLPSICCLSQKVTWDSQNVQTPQKIWLHPIHLISSFLSQSKTTWASWDMLTPLTVVSLSLLVLPVVLMPSFSEFFILFEPFFHKVSSRYHFTSMSPFFPSFFPPVFHSLMLRSNSPPFLWSFMHHRHQLFCCTRTYKTPYYHSQTQSAWECRCSDQ